VYHWCRGGTSVIDNKVMFAINTGYESHTLRNSAEIPVVGFGCAANIEIVEEAYAKGCRLFDSASLYAPGDRGSIGESLGKFPRTGTTLQSKLWMDQLGEEDVAKHVDNILSNLKTNYLDVLLIHWPIRTLETFDKPFKREHWDILHTWNSMERLVDAGKVKSLGLCNACAKDLAYLLAHATHPPSLLQTEIHPYNQEQELVDFCHAHHIHVQCHSIMGCNVRDSQQQTVLENDVLKRIAGHHDTSVSMVVLQWCRQRGLLFLTSTKSSSHLVENFSKPSFMLSKSDMLAIKDLDNKHAFWKNQIMVNMPVLSDEHVVPSVNETQHSVNMAVAGIRNAGYYLLPNLLDEALVKEISAEATKRLSSNERYGDYSDIRRMAENALFWDHVIGHSTILKVVRSILGEDCVLDHLNVSVCQPGSELFGPHVDRPFTGLNAAAKAPLPPANYPIVIQCIFMLDDFRVENGCTYVVPYSSKEQYQPAYGVLPENVQTIEGEAGSVIVANGCIWHGALPNKSLKARRSLLCEYVIGYVAPCVNYSQLLKDSDPALLGTMPPVIKQLLKIDQGPTLWRGEKLAD